VLLLVQCSLRCERKRRREVTAVWLCVCWYIFVFLYGNGKANQDDTEMK